jgi:hypothetical protein
MATLFISVDNQWRSSGTPRDEQEVLSHDCMDISTSAGDLSSDAAKLEKQLSLHFELADHWNALLLLDEADVFLRKRDTDHTHNSLVSVFLRKLEYYQGIMLLTTNRVRDFDDAIQSRIHLALRYGPLVDESAAMKNETTHTIAGRHGHIKVSFAVAYQKI